MSDTKPSVWQSILSAVSSTVSTVGSSYMQNRAALEIEKRRLKDEAALQKATVAAYGGTTTTAAINAVNQARLLEATERARAAEINAGTTAAPIIGGMTTTTLLLVLGVGAAALVLANRGK